MASVMTNLDAVVQEYVQDTEFQQEWQMVAEQRRASIPHYQSTVHKFIDGTYNLDEFRNALKTLHQDKTWGASSPGFLMVLNQLANNHVPTNPDIEANFRFILRDLNTQNVGQHIEQFYNLLIQEKKRLEVSGLSDKKIASPGNSAFIISLLAFWLNYRLLPPRAFVPCVSCSSSRNLAGSATLSRTKSEDTSARTAE